MIGDLYLFIRKLFNQTFCIHNYKHKIVECGMQQFTYKVCDKCKREIWR